MKKENNTLKRRAETLETINKNGKVSVSELSKKYTVSEVTIRNDLSQLESKGLLIKTRGGAIKAHPSSFVLSLHQKLQINYPEKQKIGLEATKFVKDGYAIVLDSGSTALEVAKNLKQFKNLTLITNSLPIADICAEYTGIDIIITGGKLRADMRSLIGSIAESTVLNFTCDLAIIGADSISPERGLFTPLNSDAIVSRAMVHIAQKVVVVVDSSKFKKKSLIKICEIDKIDTIITDAHILETDVQLLKKSSIDVIIVE